MERFYKDFTNTTDVDVAIAEAGASGLVAAKYLAESGFEQATHLFNREQNQQGGKRIHLLEDVT